MQKELGVAVGIHTQVAVLVAVVDAPDENARELEGALNRVVTLSRLTHQPLATELVETALGHLGPQRSRLTEAQILDAAGPSPGPGRYGTANPWQGPGNDGLAAPRAGCGMARATDRHTKALVQRSSRRQPILQTPFAEQSLAAWRGIALLPVDILNTAHLRRYLRLTRPNSDVIEAAPARCRVSVALDPTYELKPH